MKISKNHKNSEKSQKYPKILFKFPKVFCIQHARWKVLRIFYSLQITDCEAFCFLCNQCIKYWWRYSDLGFLMYEVHSKRPFRWSRNRAVALYLDYERIYSKFVTATSRGLDARSGSERSENCQMSPAQKSFKKWHFCWRKISTD